MQQAKGQHNDDARAYGFSMAATRPRVTKNLSKSATELLGPVAMFLSYSRSAHTERHPDHVTLFNARVFNRAGEIIWSGDLDLSDKLGQLQQLAEIEGPILVTPEYPHRWKGLPAWFDFDADDQDRELELRSCFPFRPDFAEQDRARVIAQARYQVEALDRWQAAQE